MFEHEGQPEERKRRDPILPAKPSALTQAEKRFRQTAGGFPVHSFDTLLSELASRAKVTYEMQRDNSKLTFRQLPEPTPPQAHVYELIRVFPVIGN